MSVERLQKLIACAGICSRRAAEELISAGRVTVFKYTRGLVKIGDSLGYVRVGNGSRFPFRLGCPPEIAYFTLKGTT